MKILLFVIATAATLSTTSLAKPIVIDGQQAQYKTQTTAEVTHTEYTQEVRDATCSRQVAVGSHEVCSNVGGDQVCDTVGGGEVCHDVGGEEECENVGGGEVCHDVGGGQQCGLTPSGNQCFDLPSHRECYQTPGRRECRSTPSRRECYQTPGRRECYTTPVRRECNTVTDTETEYYSCKQSFSVPHVVKDFELENNIVINVEINRKLPAGLKEVIDFDQTATALTIKSVQSTGKVLLYATQSQTEVSNNHNFKKLKTIVTIKMMDRNLALGAFLSPIGEITADSNGFKITTGLILDAAAVHFDVLLSRNKLFGKDEVVLQKSLLSSEGNLVNSDSQTVISFDFEKLGVKKKVAGKKIDLSLIVQTNLAFEGLVNRQDIPASIGTKKVFAGKLK
jgi:hypothetical protein